jgi:hypothetical protein
MWHTIAMTARDEVQKRIDKKRTEIAELEAQLRDGKVYIQAMEEALRLLPREDGDSSPSQSSSGNLRPGSKVDRARDAIRSAGSALHIVDLVTALGIKNTQENRAALAGSLSAYARRNEIFTRPAPNTFGLIGGIPKKSGQGPPAHFGIDDVPESDLPSEATISNQGITDENVPF